MKITFESSEPTLTRILCEGNVTQHELMEHREALEKMLEETPFRDRVLLNMSKVSRMDTAGISWLMNHHNQSKERGEKFVVCHLSPLILEMLHLMHADKVLHIARDENEAKQMLDSDSE